MQSGSGYRGSESDVKSDINVTPLVDVCLVLLIIFMVVTPMLQKGVDVQLPETAKPEKMPEGAKQLTVAVKLDGTVFVGKDWVPDEKLAKMFREIHEQSPEKDIVIKADKRLKYSKVRNVMRVINEAGFGGVGLVAEHKVAGING
jgi:biopolymer transport protein ExbD